MTDETLVAVFVPSLVVRLANHEAQLGRPLTAEEVAAVRDAATCIMVPAPGADEVRARRGYDDIDPDRAFEAWGEWRAMGSRTNRPEA